MTPKQQLIQRLYDDKHISFEEMILLMEEQTYIPFYPLEIYQIYPTYPSNPYPLFPTVIY